MFRKVSDRAVCTEIVERREGRVGVGWEVGIGEAGYGVVFAARGKGGLVRGCYVMETSWMGR